MMMTEGTITSDCEGAHTAPLLNEDTPLDPLAEGTRPPSTPASSSSEICCAQEVEERPSSTPSNTMPTPHLLPPPQSPYHHPPQIRHAGRALIRGKFRRIWRPRYLEVYDTGLVRYYEVPPASTSPVIRVIHNHNSDENNHDDRNNNYIPGDAYYDDENPSNRHNSMMSCSDPSKLPKCTLWIHHARIIDVTTLRDMHVGLPRGSFGFLFHGHYQDSVDPQHHHNQQQYHYANQLQLPTAAHSLIMPGQACQGGEPVIPSPRDFLCAVESLEEAQMWVVALQWAANMGKSSSYQATWFPPSSPLFPTPATTPAVPPSPLDEEVGDDSQQSAPRQEEASTLSTQQKLDQLQEAREALSSAAFTSRDELLASTTSADSKQPPSLTPQQKHASTTTPGTAPIVKAPPKMVVTKVTGFSIVRVKPLQWDIAYRIQVLLVVPSQHLVQEWTLLRTSQDLSRLLHALDEPSPKQTRRRNTAKKDVKWRKKSWQIVQSLPSLPSVSSNNKATAVKSPQDWNKAVQQVEVMLRNLCMEAAVVNEAAMKSFLGVALVEQTEPRKSSITTTMAVKSSFWKYHDPTALLTQPQMSDTKSITTDKFVKQWFQQQIKRAQHQTQLQTEQFWKVQLLGQLLHPQTVYRVAGVAVFSATILPLIQRWLRIISSVMPHVSIRLDCLALSWLVAAGLGRTWAAREDYVADRPLGTGVNAEMSPMVSAAFATKAAVISEARYSSKVTAAASLIDGASAVPDGVVNPLQATAAISRGKDATIVLGDQVDANVVGENTTMDDYDLDDSGGEPLWEEEAETAKEDILTSPLPVYNPDENVTASCWSKPYDDIFRVRGPTYLTDRIKIPSGKASFTCLGVDMWLTDNPGRNIARHPTVLGGRLAELTANKQHDIFLVNFLLPFGNFVSYFSVPPLSEFSTPQLAGVWSRFIKGDQQYRDARLKLLPVVVDGPWIVRAAVGPGTSPALLGKVIPLQYFFSDPKISPEGKKKEGGVYEVDVIITASTIAKGILSVVKGHTKSISIAFAFIIEAAKEKELPEQVLCSFQVHSIHLEDCPHLPECNLDDVDDDDITGCN